MKKSMVGAVVAGFLFTTALVAQEQVPTPSSVESLAPSGRESPAATEANAPRQASRIHIHEGTEVPLLFVDSLSSATAAEGDRFTSRVDGDVKIDGAVM